MTALASATQHATGSHPAADQPDEARAVGARKITPYLLLIPGLAWLVLFFIVPMVQLAVVSLESKFPGYPGYYYLDLAVWNYRDALSEFWPHIIRSFVFAGVATILAFIIGYPLAYAMAFKAGKWRNVMMILVIAPFFTSFILRTIAWRQILADEGPVASTLNALHLLPGGHITETWVAVVAGLTYNFLPFMTLPMSMPGVLAGTLMTFIPASGDYVNAELLGSDISTKMVGNAIESQFFRVPGGYPTAAALSFTLMAIILVMLFAYTRKFGTENLL